MRTVDDKKTPVDQPAGSEAHEVPVVEASPVPVVGAEVKVRGGVKAVLAGLDGASSETETPEAMFQDPARFFLVIEDIPPLNRTIVRALKDAGASEGNVLPAKNLAEVTAAIETLKGKEGIKEVVVVCDMKFPDADDYENPRAGIEAIKQLQAYAAESGVTVSIIFNSSETSLRDEDRRLIDAAKAGDTDGEKNGAVNVIRAMFDGRVPKAS